LTGVDAELVPVALSEGGDKYAVSVQLGNGALAVTCVFSNVTAGK
jgi:hypothetical protein